VSAGTVGALCERIRPELACLGELGTSLLATVGVVEAMAGERGVEALADPSFALEVLMASGAEGDAAVDEQAAAAERIGLHLAEQVPWHWTGSDLTFIAAQDNVRGLRSWEFPDGTLGDGVVPAITFWGQAWLEEGAER
jgi:hypothetical protein